MQDFPDTLDCSIPQETDAITPEEREEVKVSGPYWFCNLQEHLIYIVPHSINFHALYLSRFPQSERNLVCSGYTRFFCLFVCLLMSRIKEKYLLA